MHCLNLSTYYLLHLPRPRVCTCLASPQLASLAVRGSGEGSLASDLERGAGLRACVHGDPPTEPTERTSEPPTVPTLSEPTPTEPPSSRDEGEALHEDSVSQSKGEL